MIVVDPGEDECPSSEQFGLSPSLVPCVEFGAGDQSPSSPQSPTPSGEESLPMEGKGTVMLPLDVELLVIPPWAPVAAIIEAAFFWLVQATNYPNGDISVR